jgi:HTH-type transcriptional regulator/antitoxin HigA
LQSCWLNCKLELITVTFPPDARRYERKRWPIEPPDTIDAIRYRMETGGYTQADLGRLLGSRQRASDILTRKRPLTMRMAWRLHREWGIPAEALIAPPQTRRRKSAA